LASAATAADLAQEYREAKAARDRAAAELAAQSKRLQDAANDPIARARAGKAVEQAQSSYASAQKTFDSVVRKMKPGDAIWVQETAVGMTGAGAPGGDRYAPQVPAVGEGVPVDPHSVGLGAGVGEFDLMAKPPPMIGAPGAGPQGAAGAPAPGVTYGLSPGFDNPKLHDAETAAALMHPGAPKVRDPRKPPSAESGFEAPAEPPPPQEGVPFTGPLPEPLAQVGFVVFPTDETFPSLLAFEARTPGAGSLKVLSAVSQSVRRGDLAGAWTSAAVLVERHPEDPGVRRLAAVLNLRLGKLDAADAHIQAALRLDPANAEAWTVLAWVRLRQGRRGEAGRAARWALRLDPGFSGAAAALKASGVPAAPPSGPVLPPALSPAPPPSAAAPAAAAEPEAPAPQADWGAFVLGVAAVSGAALAFALKGLLRPRKI
jgi:tetratricopeptide (TPR) repeat protein